MLCVFLWLPAKLSYKLDAFWQVHVVRFVLLRNIFASQNSLLSSSMKLSPDFFWFFFFKEAVFFSVLHFLQLVKHVQYYIVNFCGKHSAQHQSTDCFLTVEQTVHPVLIGFDCHFDHPQQYKIMLLPASQKSPVGLTRIPIALVLIHFVSNVPGNTWSTWCMGVHLIYSLWAHRSPLVVKLHPVSCW